MNCKSGQIKENRCCKKEKKDRKLVVIKMSYKNKTEENNSESEEFVLKEDK